MNIFDEKAKQLILKNQRLSTLIYTLVGTNSRKQMWHLINSLYEQPQEPREKLSLLLNEPIKIQYIYSRKILKAQIEDQIEKYAHSFLQKNISLEIKSLTKLGATIENSTADLMILDEIHRSSLELTSILQSQRQNAKGTSLIVLEGNRVNFAQGFDYIVKLNFD